VAKDVKTSKSGTSADESAAADGQGSPPASAAEAPAPAQLDPEVAKKIAAVRSQVRESFGQVVMAMMMLPRYRNQTIADLQHLVLEPLIRDRIAIAYPGGSQDNALADIAGMAIWASVSEEVDGRIREQIREGIFPLRLKSEDWASGEINWLIDVIAPDQAATARVIANFKQVVKEGSLRLHPHITRLVDAETLKKMGAERLSNAPAAPVTTAPSSETVN
jgi:hemolysin-activating ACP:hemolysin acyltransferase